MVFAPKYLAYGLGLPLLSAMANDDVGQRLLHTLQQSQNAQERQWVAPALAAPVVAEEGDDAIAPIILDGQAYTIAPTVSEVGQALYVALQRQQWPDVARLLPIYAGLPEHDVTLLWFAQGTWARAKGDYAEAVARYRAILALQPDFLRTQLELGRTLFEDHQNQEARAMFASIAPEALSEGLSKTIATYVAALDQREAWHGSLSLGPVYNNNLNQSSQINRCDLMHEPSGLCLSGFFAEDKLRAFGTTYEGTLTKRGQWQGHHGFLVRGVAYGQTYWHEREYAEANVLAYAGYHYRNAANNVSLLPLIEFNRYGGHTISKAYGVRAEGQRMLSQATSVNLDVEHKRQSFAEGYRHNDGKQQAVFVTVNHMVNPEFVLFGGGDGLRKKTSSPVNSHQQLGLRLGAYSAWSPGLSATFYTSLRYRKYQGFNAFLGAQRKEHEQAYHLVLQLPRLKVWGFNPSLNLKHTRVSSNADFVYSHKKNEASLRLNHSF